MMLKVLEESSYLGNIELIPVASERSIGKIISFKGKDYAVVEMRMALKMNPHIAIFSAGAATSKKWAPEFAEKQCFVIDNSSAWRMEEDVPLVVPEINADAILKSSRIIANPNCSTIQLLAALAPIHREYGIKRLVISTYQSVTGTGVAGVKQLENERKGKEGRKAYPHKIDLNLIPHGGHFLKNGYTSEEQKLVDESRKILRDNNIQITATVVRVPVYGGHSESVNVEMKKPYKLEDVRNLFEGTKGIVVEDDVNANIYPMPLMAEGKNDVFVGRIRRDESCDNSLNLWIVSDNLRKGAATNAVQIAEYLIGNKMV